MIQPRHLVLTLVTGESACVQRKLAWGVPLPRLAVGTHADWLVSARGVLATHVLLSFDGHRLRAMAASDAAEVRLHGQPLSRGWSELPLPFELAFGGARIAGCAVAANTDLVRAAGHSPGSRAEAASGASAASPVETQLFDLSALRAAALAPHAIVSLGNPLSAAPTRTTRARPAPPALAAAAAPHRAPQPQPSAPARSPLPFEVVSGSTLVGRVGGGTARRQTQTGMPIAATPPRQAEPARAKPAAASSPLSCTQTVSDRGALQAYARRLAADQNRAGPNAANGRHGARGTARPAATSTLLPLVAKQRAFLSDRLRRVTHRERLLALPGLVVPVLIWLSAASPSAGSNGAAADPPPASASADVLPDNSGRIRGLGAHTLDAAPDPSSTPPRVAPVADAVSPSDTAPSPAPHRSAAAAKDPEAPNDESKTDADDSMADAQERVALESDAFRAAFGGNTSEGVALYEELALTRGDETFRRAARLLARDRVRKP